MTRMTMTVARKRKRTFPNLQGAVAEDEADPVAPVIFARGPARCPARCPACRLTRGHRGHRGDGKHDAHGAVELCRAQRVRLHVVPTSQAATAARANRTAQGGCRGAGHPNAHGFGGFGGPGRFGDSCREHGFGVGRGVARELVDREGPEGEQVAQDHPGAAAALEPHAERIPAERGHQ